MDALKKSDTLQDVVNSLMRQQNKTPTSIEKDTGLSKNTIYSITTGKHNNPSLSTLRLLAIGLNVKIESLIVDNYGLKKDEILSLEEMKAFADTAAATVERLIGMKKNLTLQQLLRLINEFYEYSIGVEPHSVDERYIKHILDKKFSDKN